MSFKVPKKRDFTHRKLVNTSSVQQKYRRAVLEAAAEISHEFSEHFWKEILQNGDEKLVESAATDPMSNEALQKGFIFYLNASGRYLILREYLRSSISSIVQQRCLSMRPSGFQNHSDFQNYLNDIYVFLVDEMHEVLNSTSLQETDPLNSNLDRLLQHTNVGPDDQGGSSSISRLAHHQRQINEIAIFAEEAMAQGDIETCNKLHMYRICKDNESSRTWTEFAIMWLSRGDDRMAELTIQEALHKEPLNLYALIISGVISIRHGYERGLECLEAALEQRPMAPEVLVIVGLAHNILGNDSLADNYFRKAGYIQRTVTAEKTTDLDKLYSKGTTPLPHSVAQLSQSIDAFDKAKRDEENSIDAAAEAAAESKQASKKKKRSKRIVTETDQRSSSFVQRKSGGAAEGEKNSRRSKKISTLTLPAEKTEKAGAPKEPDPVVDARKSEEAGGIGLNTPQPDATEPSASADIPSSKMSLMENLKGIQLEDVTLPPLSPSIQSPWDVTEYSEKLEQHLRTVEYLASSSKHVAQKHASTNKYIKKDEGIVSDSAIKEEYDDILEKEVANSVSTFKSGSSKSISRGSSAQSADAVESGRRDSLEKVPGNESRSQHNRTKEPSVAALPPLKKRTGSSPQLTNRLGSELIWTANLLLNLRLYDFLDGVLAKHLYIYKNRTIQYLYLRAISLYLRQRENEALPLIKEANALDMQNGIFWALEGHCHYMMGNTEEALRCYETALKLPSINENRHLLYLRFGSLILNSDQQSKLAKRVFLHAVGRYPTPSMWLSLGNACLHRQEYDEAESSFSEANRLDNTNPIIWGHLALSSLLQNKKTLAEQSYKWAVRFGLKKGDLFEEIQRLQREKGFGDPSFPRVPSCLVDSSDGFIDEHNRPFHVYKDLLDLEPPRMQKGRFDNTQSEELLRKTMLGEVQVQISSRFDNEWAGEGDEETLPFVAEEEEQFEEEIEIEEFQLSEHELEEPPTSPPPPAPSPKRTKSEKKEKSESARSPKSVKSKKKTHTETADLVTIKGPPADFQ